MLETVVGAIYVALFVFAGGAFVYTGLRGLRGREIALPTKSGSLRVLTGRSARIGGAMSLILGVLLFCALLWQLFK